MKKLLWVVLLTLPLIPFSQTSAADSMPVTSPPVPGVLGGCGAPCTPAPLDSVAPPIHNYTPEETAANEAHAREVAAATGGCANVQICNPSSNSTQNPPVQTSVPPNQQIGSWALVDQNGKVVTASACQEIVCGPNGNMHTITNSQLGCELGCTYVLQAPPNPITGQGVGGWSSGGDTTVTYKDGVFTILTRTLVPGTTIADGKYEVKISTVKDGISTNSDGIVFDHVNNKILDPGHAILVSPAKVLGAELDAGTPIEQVFADAIAAGTMAIKKSKSGYLFDTNWDTSKTDKKITVVATKKGAASRKVTLVLNEGGDLVLNSKVNLKGYLLNVKVDGRLKARILVTK